MLRFSHTCSTTKASPGAGHPARSRLMAQWRHDPAAVAGSAATICLSTWHPPHMSVQVAAAEQGQQRVLGCLRGPVADVLLSPGDHPGKITTGDQPAHPMTSLTVR